MSIFTKLNTLLRAGARESAERDYRCQRYPYISPGNCRRGKPVGQKKGKPGLSYCNAQGYGEGKWHRGNASAREKNRLLRSRPRKIGGASDAGRQGYCSERRACGEAGKARGSHRERINSEELTLRKLVTEIKEHRREIAYSRPTYRVMAGSLPAIAAELLLNTWQPCVQPERELPERFECRCSRGEFRRGERTG